MNFSADLIESFGRLVKRLFDYGLDIFYWANADDNIVANEEELERTKKAVELHEKTFKHLIRLIRIRAWTDKYLCPY